LRFNKKIAQKSAVFNYKFYNFYLQDRFICYNEFVFWINKFKFFLFIMIILGEHYG